MLHHRQSYWVNNSITGKAEGHNDECKSHLPASPELAAAVLGSAADGFSAVAVAVAAVAAADGCC